MYPITSSGMLRTGAIVSLFFSYSNDSSQSSIHMNFMPFVVRRVSGVGSYEKIVKNIRKYTVNLRKL